MRWVDTFGDRDQDGFQEYGTRSTKGYYNQGWKDAGDAIPAADGTLAPLPLAVCELQGYAYDAKARMAEMYELFGRPREASACAGRRPACTSGSTTRSGGRARAPTSSRSMAQEAHPSVASNAGHLLESGIVPPDRAGRVVKRLLADDMWSGWGIRTLSRSTSPTTRSATTRAPSGPTTTPSSRAASPLRVRGRGGARSRRDLRRGGLLPHAPPAGAVRRVAARRGLVPGAVPRRERATGVGGGPIIRLISVMCGISAVTDASGSRLYLDPALPGWLPELTITNLRAGNGALALRFSEGTAATLANTSGLEVVAGPDPMAVPRGQTTDSVGSSDSTGQR